MVSGIPKQDPICFVCLLPRLSWPPDLSSICFPLCQVSPSNVRKLCQQDLVACSEEAQLSAVPAVAEVLRSRFPQDPQLPVGLVQVRRCMLSPAMTINRLPQGCGFAFYSYTESVLFLNILYRIALQDAEDSAV